MRTFRIFAQHYCQPNQRTRPESPDHSTTPSSSPVYRPSICALPDADNWYYACTHTHTDTERNACVLCWQTRSLGFNESQPVIVCMCTVCVRAPSKPHVKPRSCLWRHSFSILCFNQHDTLWCWWWWIDEVTMFAHSYGGDTQSRNLRKKLAQVSCASFLHQIFVQVHASSADDTSNKAGVLGRNK